MKIKKLQCNNRHIHLRIEIFYVNAKSLEFQHFYSPELWNSWRILRQKYRYWLTLYKFCYRVYCQTCIVLFRNQKPWKKWMKKCLLLSKSHIYVWFSKDWCAWRRDFKFLHFLNMQHNISHKVTTTYQIICWLSIQRRNR